jgi:hypothetical protein
MTITNNANESMTKKTNIPIVEEEIIYDKPRIIIQKIQFDDPSMKIKLIKNQ